MLRNWDQIKQTEPGREQGVFGEVPENLPGPLYARKVQRRAASSGFDFPDVEQPRSRRCGTSSRSSSRAGTPDERFHELGDVLFAAVNVARKLHVDPELALRAAVRPLPDPRHAGDRAGRIRRPGTGTISAPTSSWPTTPRARLTEEGAEPK